MYHNKTNNENQPSKQAKKKDILWHLFSGKPEYFISKADYQTLPISCVVIICLHLMSHVKVLVMTMGNLYRQHLKFMVQRVHQCKLSQVEGEKKLFITIEELLQKIYCLPLKLIDSMDEPCISLNFWIDKFSSLYEQFEQSLRKRTLRILPRLKSTQYVFRL